MQGRQKGCSKGDGCKFAHRLMRCADGDACTMRRAGSSSCPFIHPDEIPQIAATNPHQIYFLRALLGPLADGTKGVEVHEEAMRVVMQWGQ
eukprot:gene28693-50656_t